jgi:hypothetical protein
VDAVVLDRLLASEPQVDFVKIDAQGAELGIVRGLVETLARCPRIQVLCEVCPALLLEAGGSAEALLERFDRARLQPHLLDRRGSLEPLSAPRALRLAGRKGFLNLLFRA